MTSLLSIDPSSTACGLAHWPSIEGCYPEPDYLHVVRRRDTLPMDRIDAMVESILVIARRLLPDVVVIEYSGGKVARRLKGRGVSGLAVLGQAQGRIYQSLLDSARYRASRFDPEQIVPVSESEWTKGDRRSKEERARQLELACPIYRDYAAQDPGRDAADACLLGGWWIAKHCLAENVRRASGDSGDHA